MSTTKHYNRFDPAKHSWVSVLAVGGRRLQTAELNEMQSLALHRDKQFGDFIFGTGNVLEGGQLWINQTTKELVISPARVYVDGMILLVEEQTLTITAEGEELIGLKVDYQVITYEHDTELLDPAVGYSNHGMPGADRLVAKPTWVVNNPVAIQMYRLIDGVLATPKIPQELEGLTPVLARRTHDTSGNFLVSGMDGFIEVIPGDEDNLNLVIDAGKAYVQGYEINKLIPERIRVPRAKEYQTVKNELKRYVTTEASYKLHSQPVKELVNVSAVVQVSQTVTRGNMPGTSDSLVNRPVVDIISVTRGPADNKITYDPQVDFEQDGDRISWKPSGKEPEGGTNYTVTYTYNKKLVLGEDIALENGYLVFKNGGAKPVNQTQVQVEYTFYLPRIDVYYLTADGKIKVVRGQSAMQPPTPTSPPDVLELGEISFPANSVQAIVTNRKPKRLTMLELRSLLDRLERAEYNQAINDLDRAAQYADPAVTKKGIFTDNFTNFARADMGDGTQFDAMIDPRSKSLQLPIEDVFFDLQINTEKSSVRMHERLLTINYTEEVLIDQSNATESMNVNPYQVFGNMATVRLTPSHDIWLEQTVITRYIWGWWWDWWNQGRTETRVILDEYVPFIRVRAVQVQAEGFTKNATNIQATFDGVPINLVPSAGSQAGALSGTMKADANGRFSCTFVIPAQIRTGTREVRFWNNTD
ncbi:UNVERIFIED_CONTAM: hypothetical protein ABID98_004838 [Brevibacillus sp. OAP136]